MITFPIANVTTLNLNHLKGTKMQNMFDKRYLFCINYVHTVKNTINIFTSL